MQAPPTIPGLPVIGSALNAFLKDPRIFLLDQYRSLGPIFRLRAFHINYVVMAGPSANQFANHEGRGYFSSRAFWKGMLRELEAENFLIGIDGEDHALLRKMYRKSFARTTIDPQREIISELCFNTFSDLKTGEVFGVVDRILRLNTQMIGCLLTGRIPTRKELDHFFYYLNTVTNHLALHRLPRWMLKFRAPKFRKAKKLTFKFADSVVDGYVTGANDLHNFVDAVMEAADKCPHLFEPGDIRFSAILPLFAGVDTMGQTINYALYELHRHPEILARVQTEIDDVFSSGVPTVSKLKEMTTLSNVITETLRLHPTAFGMVRTANRDFEFEGYSVKKGEDVVILTTASHFMEEYFREPYKFDLNRYDHPRNEHRQRNVMAPFGRGPHTCLGAGLAESLMALTLGSILFTYRFEDPCPNRKYKERVRPTPSLGDQFKLRLLGTRN